MAVEHLLHLKEVEEGSAWFTFTCEHDDDDPKWLYRYPNGDIVEPPQGCWLESWWEGVGSELVDIRDIVEPITFPIAVKPSPGWDYEDGGTIIPDGTTTMERP